ncbi:hypothetical protein ACP70R_020344 [Stipagrostis hirtigluma subsp. patula]
MIAKEKEVSEHSRKKMRKGLWSPDEDERLYSHITNYGVGTWSSVAELAGLKRSGKSCRLRWMNYLQPDLRKDPISKQEEDLIISLQKLLGNRWSAIAARMPGRTDNEIKNYWNSRIRKRLQKKSTDGHKSPEVWKSEEGSDCNTDRSTTTSRDNAADHRYPRLPIFRCQLPLAADPAAHGEQTAQSFSVPLRNSKEIDLVEEYVEFLMSLPDELPDI